MTATGVVADDIERLALVMRTDRWSGAGDTVVRVRAIPEGIVGEELVIDPTGTAQIVTVVSVQDRDITVDTALSADLEPDTAVMRKIFAEFITSGAQMSLAADASATDTTVTVKSKLTGLVNKGGWVLIDPYTDEAEIREVTAISSNEFTIAALDYAHSENDPVLWLQEPKVHARLFGAKGDGSTNDTQAINRGITQLSSFNGTLVIPGDSVFEVTQLTLESNITIEGNGFGSVIQNTDNDAPTIYGLEKDNITIRNLRLNGGTSTGGTSHQGIQVNDSDNIIIDGCWIHGFQHAGITVRGEVEAVGTRRVKITNNHIYSIASHGIWAFRANDYIVIQGNTVNGCGGYGIVLDDATTVGWIDPSQLSAIIGNICHDNTGVGIQLEGAQSVAVVGNICHSNGRNIYFGATQNGIGIGLANLQQEGPCAYNVIANNVIRGNRKQGISLQAAQYNIIEGNHLYNNTEGGPSSLGIIHLQNNATYSPAVGSSFNKIVNNFILNKSATASAQAAIRIDDSDCTENEIRGNTLRDENTIWAADINDNGTNTIITTDNIGIQVEGRNFDDNDATPSVKDRKPYYQANYTLATDITDLDDGTVGQMVTIRVGTNNVTFKDVSTTGNFELAGSADYNPTAVAATITFLYSRVPAGTARWREISRSEN